MHNVIKSSHTTQQRLSLSDVVGIIESTTGLPAKQNGKEYSLRCPAHDDKNPSLNASIGNDGTILLNCHALCSFADICASLNIEQSSLFPEKYDLKADPSNIQVHRNGTKTYAYHDEQKQLLCWKLRLPGKDFRWQRYDEKKNIVYGIQGCRMVLYQLPRTLLGISENKKIFLVEGEKDASTLIKRNLVATTAPTPKWLEEYTQTLKDADVIVLYDYDKAGFKRRDLLRDKLFGKVKRLRIVDLPGLEYSDSHGKDITDWLEMGHTIEELLELVEKTPDYSPSRKSGGIVTVSLEEFLQLQITKPDALLSPFLWTQGLVLLYAKRGVGKTHIALGIAYAVARGGSFLKWTAPGPKKVLYIDGEMSAYSMQERLRNMTGDDGSKVLTNNLLFITPDLQESAMPNLSTIEGREAVEQIISDRDLIVVDNLSSLFRSGVENDAESWMPIQEWALELRRKGKTVLFVHHAGKSGGQRGTSKKEDILDVVIGLKQPDDYQAKQGAHFEVHFEKTRHFAGEDAASFQVRLSTNENGHWVWEISDIDSDPEISRIANMRKEGKTIVEIMGKTNLTKSQIETRITKAKEGGLLE